MPSDLSSAGRYPLGEEIEVNPWSNLTLMLLDCLPPTLEQLPGREVEHNNAYRIGGRIYLVSCYLYQVRDMGDECEYEYDNIL